MGSSSKQLDTLEHATGILGCDTSDSWLAVLDPASSHLKHLAVHARIARESITCDSWQLSTPLVVTARIINVVNSTHGAGDAWDIITFADGTAFKVSNCEYAACVRVRAMRACCNTPSQVFESRGGVNDEPMLCRIISESNGDDEDDVCTQ